MRQRWPRALLGLIAAATLAACQTAPVPDTHPPVSTVTPTIAPPTATRARIPTVRGEPTEPTATPRVPTATATPIQTRVSIPVSTYDAAHAVTRTPASAAVCPAPQSDPPGLAETVEWLYPTHDFDESDRSARELAQQTHLLAVLDAGGAEALSQAVSATPIGKGRLRLADLTGDGIVEVVAVYSPGWISGILHVYGCEAGRYRELLTVPSLEGETPPRLNTIADVNANGTQDLVIDQDTCHWCYAMQVFEWDGTTFQSLVRQWLIDPERNELSYADYAELSGVGHGRVQDLDGNGVLELVIEGGIPSYSAALWGMEGPWREQTVVYGWDGHYFVWSSQRYAPAIFRFEAVQDADVAALRGDYAGALTLYQDVIFSDQLRSWSLDDWQRLRDLAGDYPDPSQMPFNPAEHAALSAYARFRIMVLYVRQDLSVDAATVYRNLLDQVSADGAGASYRELARVFWEAIQANPDLGSACAAAVTFVKQRPELLDPLGNSDGRMWGRYYQPKDVCPFGLSGER